MIIQFVLLQVAYVMKRTLCISIATALSITMAGCIGTDGTNGTNGATALVSVASEPAGTNCTFGGQKSSAGIDVNGNGVLDASEVSSVHYVCDGATGPAGPTIPVIDSLYLTRAPALPGGTIEITVSARSAENLTLTYSWSVSNGWAIASGERTSVATITAPTNYAAAGTATVTVADALGQSAVGTIALSTVNNSAPVIESISIYPQPVLSSANLDASAFDQNGDKLTYSWTIGGISNILAGSSAVWNSPGIPGLYKVGLEVSDGTTTVNGSSSISIGSASPWPVFGRDIQATRLSTADTSANIGLLKWSYATGSSVYSSPAIGAGGTVYVGSDKLYAINSDGTLKWSYPTGSNSPAVGADGTVYVGSGKKILAINHDGSLKWSFTTGGIAGGTVLNGPAISADGTVYAGASDGTLFAMIPDGTKKWSIRPGGPNATPASSPAIGADGTVYFMSDNFYAVNPDGTLKWSYPTGGTSPAIGADGTVYVGASDGLHAINGDGTLKWSYPTWSATSPAIGADGTVYVGVSNNQLFAINRDGTLKWTSWIGSSVCSSPALGAEGTVYIGAENRKLYAIDYNGVIRWSYTTASYTSTLSVCSSPAIGADGTVYVGSEDGKLYAIN